jgi:glycosyltransferase involved in cell wall biosynthesis
MSMGPGCKVLALMDTWQVSGPGRQLVAAIPLLRARGIEVTVGLFTRQGRRRAPFLEFLESARVPVRLLEQRHAFDATVLSPLRRLATEHDVVQTHGYKPTACLAVLRATHMHVPWIAFFHGITTENLKVRAYHWLDMRLMRRADRLVCMSEAQSLAFSRLGVRPTVLHNAILGPIDEPPSLQPDPSGATICAIGRLSPEKGVDVLLRAVRLLGDRDIGVRCIIAGEGPERHRLETLSKDLGIAERVSFEGFVSDTSLLHRRIHLLVIPSRSEGLPNALLEAIAAGIPFVTTSVGAMPELLASSMPESLVPPESPECLASAIRDALERTDCASWRHALGELRRRLSLTARVEQLTRLYDEVRLIHLGTAA